MSQVSEYLVGCLSSHSAHFDLLTSLEISQTVSLSSDADTQDSFPFDLTHTLNPQTESLLHTCSLCVSRTLWCGGGVSWMLSGIEVHNKLQLILLQRTLHSERERAKAENESATALTTTRPHSYPLPVTIVTTVKVMETWFDSAWSQHCCVY